jgi:predicted nucleic acid-binding protein
LIVVDASALLEMLLQTQRANQLMQRALESSQRMHAPHLLDIEVTQVLRRLVQRKEITIARAEQALHDLAQLLIERHEHRALLPRVWQLRDSLTAYDAAYVALAEALEAPLLTCDAKLAGARGHRATIELVPN